MIVKQLADQTGAKIQPEAPDKVNYADFKGTVSTKTWGSTYTAPSNGWVKVYGSVQSGSTQWLFYVDNYETIEKSTSSARCGMTMTFPIMKGQKYKATGGDSTGIFFIPSIVGGGE